MPPKGYPLTIIIVRVHGMPENLGTFEHGAAVWKEHGSRHDKNVTTSHHHKLDGLSAKLRDILIEELEPEQIGRNEIWVLYPCDRVTNPACRQLLVELCNVPERAKLQDKNRIADKITDALIEFANSDPMMSQYEGVVTAAHFLSDPTNVVSSTRRTCHQSKSP